MKNAKLGDWLLWDKKLAKVVAEINYNSITIELQDPERCPHCGGILEKRQFAVIPTSPLFNEKAEPLPTIKI